VLCCAPLQKGDARSRLAITDLNSPAIHLYDVTSGSDEPFAAVTCHTAPVTALRYSAPLDVVVSCDAKGGCATAPFMDVGLIFEN
jgi:peptidylprolyl isomerase domain and WD repeat-containing protein 1